MGVLVGLAGVKRVGKDVLASHLVHEYGFKQYSLASPLKALCKSLFGLSEAQVHTTKDTIDPRYGMSPRAIFQRVGTDCIRSISPTYWTDTFRTWLSQQGDTCIVVSDVRFQDEIDVIQALGGKVVLITRECCLTCDRHVSEEAHLLDKYDGIIRNEGTIQEFLRCAERDLQRLEVLA